MDRMRIGRRRWEKFARFFFSFLLLFTEKWRTHSGMQPRMAKSKR